MSKKKYIDWFKGQKPTTAKRNAGRLKQFCEWIDKTPEQFLEEYRYTPDKKAWLRDRKNEIQGFYNFLISEEYSINSARAIPSGILSFFGRHCETVKGATALFPPPQIPEDEFIFTQEILRKAYYYTDLEGQVLLSLAVCLGNSATDFLNLEFEKLRNLDPPFFLKQLTKQ